MTLSDKIEVISINDSKPESDAIVVPHERQIVDSIIEIWKLDPETENLGISKLHAILKRKHGNWSVSEKRVKTLLKKFGLLVNNNQKQFTYVDEIESFPTIGFDMPEKVHVVMTGKRGKGLYAKKNISKGELIWQETPLFFIPPLANVNLMRHGSACAYCGKLLTTTSGKLLKGLECLNCQEVWCSSDCKNLDFELHANLKHVKKSMKSINAENFTKLQDYCLKEDWNALFAITIIQANILLDKSGTKFKQFNSMARVSQDVRYKALNSSAGAFDSLSGGALFIEEQQELLWKSGYEMFIKVFPESASTISYQEFLYMMGTYNINNVDPNIYHIQSHLNHNCNPNTTVESLPDRTQGLKVFAARDIRNGEELTTTYVNPAHPVQQRQRELRVNWGFICNCQKCKDDLNIQHRRKSSSASSKQTTKSDVQQMLAQTKEKLGDADLELEIPEINLERRKSVRFDDKVLAVSE